jgi:nucleoside-diphosphate-sugar epimerase
MNQIIEKDLKYILKNIDIENFKEKTFLITGATGALGSYLIYTLMYLNDYLETKKCKVIALCRNEDNAKLKFSEYLNKKEFKLLIGSVEEKLNINEPINYIIHAACKSNSKEFKINPVGIIEANVLGTYNLLELSRKNKLDGFLFLSSAIVYGNINKAKKLVAESDFYSSDPLNSNSCYSESKRMGENLCFSYYTQYEVPTKIVRIMHTYGPTINIKDGHVYSDFVNNILNNEDLVIKSDGKDRRGFCYVSDAVIAFFLILFKGKNGEAYNMANNENFLSINELANVLVNNVFKEKKLNINHFVEGKEKYKTRDDITEISIDTSKLNNLGWKPNIDVQEGFKKTVGSFLEL